jgi:hypothetical protein
MRGLLVLVGLICVATTLPASQTLAQSGVISGPPQVRPSQGAPAGPGAYRPDMAWIAVAAGFDGSGKRVAVGFSGQQRSRREAEDAAIRQCNRSARGFSCHTPHAVSDGCLYIVPGKRQGGGVSWGRGGTRQSALDQCRRGGYSCASSKLLGGCLPGYN